MAWAMVATVWVPWAWMRLASSSANRCRGLPAAMGAQGGAQFGDLDFIQGGGGFGGWWRGRGGRQPGSGGLQQGREALGELGKAVADRGTVGVILAQDVFQLAGAVGKLQGAQIGGGTAQAVQVIRRGVVGPLGQIGPDLPGHAGHVGDKAPQEAPEEGRVPSGQEG
jgi:hypothetical protein